MQSGGPVRHDGPAASVDPRKQIQVAPQFLLAGSDRSGAHALGWPPIRPRTSISIDTHGDASNVRVTRRDRRMIHGSEWTEAGLASVHRLSRRANEFALRQIEGPVMRFPRSICPYGP